MSTALVLGGGGVTGIAWEIGVLRGLRARGGRAAAAVDAPDLVVGTSAGSVVGTHVAAGTDLDRLFAAQAAPAPAELASSVDVTALGSALAEATRGADDVLAARRAIGGVARRVPADVADARRAAVAARLPGTRWPGRRLEITAVDVDSGEVVVFDRDAGVDLLDAVTASCAVPGVWPVVTVAGRTCTDGGVASLAHPDRAAGHDLVVVLAPLPSAPTAANPGLAAGVEGLRAAGSEVVVVGPDPDYLAGPGVAALDPAGRAEAARLGERFGRTAVLEEEP